MASEDDSRGTLVSVERIDNSNGVYVIEKTYVQNLQNLYSMSYGTDTFTKEKELYTGVGDNGTLVLVYQVTGSFDWNTSTKKVKVYDQIGEVTYNQGGDITKENTTPLGNNTSKASVKYTFTRVINPGTGMQSSKNFSLTISCNYKGVDS